MNSITRRVTAGTIAGAAALLLTACTAGHAPDAHETTTPSASATTGAASLENVTAKCEHGAATITDSNKKVTLGDCKAVTVKASNAIVELGTVDDLVVSGSISGITAGEVTTLTVTGNGNVVTTANADVNVTDTGDQNDINKQ